VSPGAAVRYAWFMVPHGDAWVHAVPEPLGLT
jgi:hypothetical protein